MSRIEEVNEMLKAEADSFGDILQGMKFGLLRMLTIVLPWVLAPKDPRPGNE